jgi:hypothetical protein
MEGRKAVERKVPVVFFTTKEGERESVFAGNERAGT